MTNFMFLIFSLTTLTVCNAQTSNSLHQSDIDLINFILKDERFGIKLVSEMTEYNLSEIKKYAARNFFLNRMVDENDRDISDTIKLSKQDKYEIVKQVENLKKFKWTLTDAKKINLNNVSIISYDSSINSNLAYAIKYHIVPPIYFKANQYCILSYSYSCGVLCGHGQITIYKRTHNGWKRWNSLAWWDE